MKSPLRNQPKVHTIVLTRKRELYVLIKFPSGYHGFVETYSEQTLTTQSQFWPHFFFETQESLGKISESPLARLQICPQYIFGNKQAATDGTKKDLNVGFQNKNGGFCPPKWMVKIMVPNPMNKWMIWEYHYFWKHPVIVTVTTSFIIPPKWMVYSSKPYFLRDDLGGKKLYPIFGLKNPLVNPGFGFMKSNSNPKI